MKPKIIIILGQTATGKSDLGVKIGRTINGEIISADSRQVYKGMDIGSGKITKKEMMGIKHHLLDVVSPKTKFSVVSFKKKAEKAIKEIYRGGKIPIIVGGTAFYIDALVDGIILPEVKPNLPLRKELEKKNTDELGKILKKLDKNRFDEIDKKNPHRLIRAIEIAKELGKVPKVKKENKYEVLKIGVKVPKEILKDKISKRLDKRLKGMIKEGKELHQNGLSFKRMESFGLEYKYISFYLRKLISKEEMIEKLNTEIYQFAKRQMTWFKKDENTIWFNPKDEEKILKTINKFLLT